MTETITTWRAEPLTWGRGPSQFEMLVGGGLQRGDVRRPGRHCRFCGRLSAYFL
jgi:hypothetical protein